MITTEKSFCNDISRVLSASTTTWLRASDSWCFQTTGKIMIIVRWSLWLVDSQSQCTRSFRDLRLRVRSGYSVTFNLKNFELSWRDSWLNLTPWWSLFQSHRTTDLSKYYSYVSDRSRPSWHTKLTWGETKMSNRTWKVDSWIIEMCDSVLTVGLWHDVEFWHGIGQRPR